MKPATEHCAWAIALLLAAAGLALACGYDFPQTLLNQRRAVLQGLRPADWLSMQIDELLPQPTDALKANEGGVATEDVEQLDLQPALLPQLRAMRAMQDGAAAYAAGEGLPEAVRLYVAGAIEFRAARNAVAAGASPAAHADAALAFFNRTLQLPADERLMRATWASYMAGRTQQLLPAGQDAGAASRYFQQVRELALSGAPDPLGLAVASYGEEGRIALGQGDLPHALDLYLAQAARGSGSARGSLQEVARRLAADADFAVRYIKDPRIQKLWFAQVVAAGFDGSWLDRSGDAAPQSWAARVARVTAVIDRGQATQLEGLAALAYATGRFELAASLARGIDTPLAALVRAKLALRAGDRATAAKEYATAIGRRSAAGPTGAAGLSDRGWSRLLAENGVLAMSRADYADALQNLLDAGSEYWLDAAHVAERVLSLDELTQFVDRQVPGASPGDVQWRNYWGRPANPQRALRLLLARRQMREQRFDAAIANFRSIDFAVDEQYPNLAALATQYAAAVRGSRSKWTRVGKAQATFEAAQLAKQFGMELLGYELAPDYYAFDGTTTYEPPVNADEYRGADEARRLAASATPQLQRFHYRGTAMELANRAADGLPPRSQAFAAVLCAGLRWAYESQQQAQALAFYGRYRREAAYVQWSPKFGDYCEEPDFGSAAGFVWRARTYAARVALRPWKIPLEVAAVALVAASLALAWRWRRRRAAS